tara:strand:- start:28 stop:264 length:237 start_codon:yes stop_codon:yes gene_type:complete
VVEAPLWDGPSKEKSGHRGYGTTCKAEVDEFMNEQKKKDERTASTHTGSGAIAFDTEAPDAPRYPEEEDAYRDRNTEG